MMRYKEKWAVQIPANLAFGSAGRKASAGKPRIPGGADLYYEIDFVAFPGFRERLHGHNYAVSVRLRGEVSARDGYVLDFGDIKVCATTTTTTTTTTTNTNNYEQSSYSDSYE